MTPVDVIDVGRDALMVLIRVSAPVMIVALLVGLVIALFQALTQIQEMTLTFVPKILAIFATLMIALPYMFEQMSDLTERLMERVVDPDLVADIPIEPKKNDTTGLPPVTPPATDGQE